MLNLNFASACLVIAGLVALAVSSRLGRRSPPVTTEDSPADLLDEALEQEMRALPLVVRPVPDERAPAEPEVLWEESAEVYAPAPADAAAWMAGLNLPLPAGLESDGAIAVICDDAHTEIHRHLRSDLTVETGGLLIGEVSHDAGRGLYLVMVRQFLPAAAGIETATSFTYTGESWAAIAPHLKALPAASTLVGTCHSHPGMGVFLSSTDLQTQAQIFSKPWQLAMVVDPVSGEEGMFSGSEGRECPWWITECNVRSSYE